MTVSTSTNRVQYNTNGTTGPWSVPFYFLADSHLAVTYTDSDGVDTALVLTTNFSVTGAGDLAGGTVTTVTSYASGGTITILRDVPATQETDYVETDSFPAEAHEAALDKLTMIVQQQQEVLTRAIVVPVSEDAPDPIPPVATRGDMLFAFDALGQPTIFDPADLGNIVASRSDVIISVADYGAVGDGVTNDTTAIDNAEAAATAAGKPLIFPEGDYLYSGTVYPVVGQGRVIDRGFSIAFTPVQLARNAAITVVGSTEDTTPTDTALNRVGYAATMVARGSQNAVGIRVNLKNYSDDTAGSPAVYAHSESDTGATWTAALHGESFHAGGTTIGANVEIATYEASDSVYGIVVSNTTASTAQTTHPITGGAKALNTSITGILLTGSVNTAENGGWEKGIRFHANSMRTGGIGISFESTTVVDALIQSSTSTTSSIADVYLRGDSAYGIILSGNYSSSALRINEGEFISLEATNTIKFKYNSGTGYLEFFNGASRKGYIDMGGADHAL